jgi:guanylate kinase
MSEPLLIVIAAPSGGGKSTVLARVFAEMSGLLFSISHTTRAARAGEVDGREYFFVDEPRFRELIDQGAFLEWAKVHGKLYGTSRAELERARREGKDLVLDIDVQGAAQIVKAYPKALTIFLRPPSVEVLGERLRRRATDTEEVVIARIHNATGEIQRAAEFRHVVLNDNLEATVREVKRIIETERAAKRRRVPDA